MGTHRDHSGTATYPSNQERHGLRKTPEYQVWLQMKGRCHNAKNKRYVYYGARGIRVCRRWRDSFLAFYEDMGPRPAGTLLERKNNDKGYCRSNCVWATRKAQARNRRNTLRYTFNGRTLTLPRWAEVTGIPLRTLRTRLKQYGWSPDRAFTTSVNAPKINSRTISYRGRAQTLQAWAKETGISRVTIASRLSRGWSAERALTS